MLREIVAWGDMGVIIFFCLSGFLITGILLRMKSTSEHRFAGLKSFYVRRALRIAPIYYLTIAIALFMGYAPAISHWFRLATYTLYVPGLPPTGYLGSFSHFWSLSIEEQFYLFWPVVILTVPRSHLRKLMLALILASWAYKLSLACCGGSYTLIFRSVFGCLDPLCLGSLLALECMTILGRSKTLHTFVKAGKLFGVICVAMTVIRIFTRIDPWYANYLWFGVIYLGVSAIAFTGFIAHSIGASKGLVGWFLKNPCVVWFGKISYGLYVYHYFMPSILSCLQRTDLFGNLAPWRNAGLTVLLSVVAAALSWFLIERPILHLKRHFQYSSS